MTTAQPRFFRAFGAAALCAALAFSTACTDGGGSGSRPVPKLAFKATVDAVAQSGDAPASLTGEGNRIVELFTAWYQHAFVGPAGWRDPEFPGVTQNFTEAARSQVRKDIASLTIGEARDELTRVSPNAATIAVTVYAKQDATPAYAVADVLFDANGTLKKKALPLHIVQRGVYYLTMEAGAWKIFSYQSREDQAQNPPRPATGASS